MFCKMEKHGQEETAHSSRIAGSSSKDGDDGGGGGGISGGGGSAKGIVVNAALGDTETRIRINKWRVREGQFVSAAQILFLYQEVGDDGKPSKAGNITVHKYKSNRAGVVKKRLRKDGEMVVKGDAIMELSECIHTTVIKDMCADCGADLRKDDNGQTSEASVPMVHTMPDLKVTQKLAQKLGHDDTRRLLADRKLVLLVDLDQTVIHTTNDTVPENIKGIYHFQLYGPQSPWYHTRLRPGTAEFLERMSQLYELHICTFGARNYAHMIAQLLDPQGKFFSHRILSRDECFNATSKTDNLKALFPNGDSMVCIIDDREDVWNMASNLIQVKPYHFFQHTGDINAPPGLSKHELDGEGVDFKDMAEKEEEKDKVDVESEIKTEDPDKGDNTVSSTSKDEDGNEEPVDVLGHESDPKDAEVTDASIVTESKELSDKVNGKVTDVDVDVDADADADTLVDNNSTGTPDPHKPASDSEDIVVDDVTSENSKDSTSALKIDGRLMEIDSKTTAVETTEKNNDLVESSTSPVDNQNQVGGEDAATTSKIPIVKVNHDEGKLIEIEDPDDYLLYLEVILRNIHKRFYAIYDETMEIPDLKIIVPKIRCEVLRGKNLVFSGLVPTQMRLEQSRAYFIAKSLGAEVQPNINKESTHLVAVNAGTYKVNAAKKEVNIRVVNANWLWTCAERWEHVEEKLFPLDRKVRNKGRQPPAHCHSPEHVVNYSERSEISPSSSKQQEEQSGNFRETLNPLLVLTNEEIDSMNKDYDTFFESDSSSDEGPVNFENPPMDKKLLKRKREDENSNRAHDFFMRTGDVMMGAPSLAEFDEDERERDDNNEDEEEDDDEIPSAKFRRGEELPSDLEIGSDSNSENNQEDEDDGEWNMMGAALEREFLGLED
ncbi:RNA polymerase II subunit A C-terminal domain phosphatase [Drosophila guanche]|uniref:RNA polymerase II subunit A C-terminal domain phosphatase n=2 Tax=Drosophila guanche TaxID=7266 RepID=A0A3B0IZW2_DROGU|nr:RNA polymerase II subunit A C-terminal domain phosphatase [Drosophila guanche]SPP73737.1 blast:RNA polymerase II subunit A C-terminal domain phosphatase [Drosophila guanche]